MLRNFFITAWRNLWKSKVFSAINISGLAIGVAAFLLIVNYLWFQYSFDNFKEPITLETVAGLAALSIPAFCMYFKKRTKKTYIDFLNELRISHACKQLTDTNAGIEEICYECGFNTLTHFHRQFRKLKGRTPLQYRVSMQKY